MDSTDPGLPAADSGRHAAIVRRVVIAGWLCLACSAVCLALVELADPGGRRGGMMLRAFLLMGARMFGLSSFAIGCIAIYNHRWTAGVFLLLLAVVLPVVAFLFHGTI